ncbi:MAG: GNAT family N-acetyltransferase [Chloroflexia bacterium]
MRTQLPGRTTTPTIAGLRPFTEGDLEPLTHLLWEARACPPTIHPAPEDVILRWKRRNIDPIYDVQVVDGPGGNLAAFVQTGLFKDGTPRLSFELAVHPGWRRRGIGSALFDTVLTRAHSLGVHNITTPVYSLPGAAHTDIARWLKHRDFKSDHSYWQMRLDNIAQKAWPHWPEGIGVRRFTDMDRDPAIWANLILRAFNESANAVGVLAQMREPGVSPDGYFFAVDLATGQDVGTSRARIDVIGGEQVGYIGTVGVLPEYRGRGIASALLMQTLEFLAGRGMAAATLFVEDHNHNARKLYDRLGWRYLYRTEHYWRRLIP